MIWEHLGGYRGILATDCWLNVDISCNGLGVLIQVKLAQHINNLTSGIFTVSRARNTIYSLIMN